MEGGTRDNMSEFLDFKACLFCQYDGGHRDNLNEADTSRL